MYCFGVDLGGTFIKMGLFDMEGSLIEKWEIPTVKPTILEDIARKIDEVKIEKGIESSDIKGVGIGVPGPVDNNGVVNGCVNLGWGIKNVKGELEKLVGGIPCHVGNDANVAAMGEMLSGGGKGHENMVMLTLGTGVGGGIIINGKMFTGVTGAAGEFGHIPVNPHETELCSCGKAGCLEQYTSATGIVRLAKMNLNRMKAFSKLSQLDEFTSKDVIELAKEEDVVAKATVDMAADYLGRACAGIACVLNNDIFVIGGGVSKAGDFLFDKVRQSFDKNVFKPCSNVIFKAAELGNDAGIYGGAAMVLR